MMNEEVINAGIKGYEYGAELYFKDLGYKHVCSQYEKFSIRYTVIWAVTQYIMNTTDQFKGFVVSSSQTQGPKCEASGKQSSQNNEYYNASSFPNPVAFYKGKWYWDFYEVLDKRTGHVIRPVISEYHAKQLYRSV